MTPEERRTEAFKALITKARKAELTSSEIVDCLRGIAKLNHPDGGSMAQVFSDGTATITLSRHRREPQYSGRCIEEALIAAHDDIARIIAEDNAAGQESATLAIVGAS